MKTIIRNVFALVGGLVFGSAVNMGLIMAGSALVPPPAGVDTSNMDALAAALPLFQHEHFVFPFLAHAIGTLAGAALAVNIAASHKFVFAMVVSVAFLAGGVTNVIMLPSPLWFSILDLVVAYLPMGLLAYKLFAPKAPD